MSTTRVLVVEDNRADARLLTEICAEAPGQSLSFSTAQTLAEALPLGAAHDVVLLDLSLPDAQGLATLEQMRAAARATPIVVLTGNDDERLATEAVKAGAQDYLLKHEITPQLVTRSIRYAIERKRVELSELQRARSELAADRAEFLSLVMSELTRSLDQGTALAGLARVLVPRLGDAALVDLVQEDGSIRLAAQAGYAGELPPIERSGSGALHDPVLQALGQRRSVLLAELDVDTADDRHRTLSEQLGARSLLVTPLLARGELIGAISFVARAGRPMPDGELQRLAEEVASHAALAIDNMRLFEQTQRAVRGRDELLAIVSHDLRNPINVLSLAVNTLESAEGLALQTLPRMRRALKRMEHLIDDLLDVARVDAGTLQVEPVPQALGPVLAELHEQWRPLCAEKSITLVKEYADVGSVSFDRERVAQVLSNLLGNAIKFTPSGGTVCVSAELLGPWVKVAVRDTGPGIAQEFLPHVFDRFWQKERRTDGLGLGLAIARGIVEAHGGNIRVESEMGRGTSFWFTLRRGDD